MAVTQQRSAGTLDVERIKGDFPILERTSHGKRMVYLDSANASQKPRTVIDTITEYYERHNANLYRAVYELAEEATAMFEEARVSLSRFIGAPDPATIVFTRGTTESINLIANAWGRRFLREGDEILFSEMEHHSNIVPWQLVAGATGAVTRPIPIEDDGTLDPLRVEALMTDRTRVLAITGQSNVLGTMPSIHRLTESAHAVGAIVVVDGAQLVPHNPVDVAELGVDFLTVSGHKMLGPTASGGLYGRLELLDAMDPFLGGGEMIMEVFPDHSTFKAPPHKFEAGTMNIAEEIGLAAAIEYLEALGMENVRRHERELTAYGIEALESAGATVFGPKDPELRGGALSFWYKDVHPHDLAQVLDQEGVCVRPGHHCAQLLMRRLGVPATTRASFYVYNTREDVDALIVALEKAGEFLALDELYKEVILDHYKNPRNKREMPEAEVSCSRNNPLCGDEITVFVHEDGGKVLDVSFVGQGCSISQSSASMMTEAVVGKSRDEVDERIGAFRGMMAGEAEADEDAFGELVALKGVVKYPVRVKCAVLAWDVLQEALAGEGEAGGSAPHQVPV